MSKKRIFVSCGQRTVEEKSFGQKIIQRIEEHGMLGFFAEEAHEPADLNTYLFTQLQRCDGFVAVLQKRGEVHYSGFPTKQRASVWIQQEIGILFYRSYLLQQPIPMRVYTEKGLIREGLITMSIINPIEFDNKEDILKNLSDWFKGPAFEEEPVLARRDSIFKDRIKDLAAEDWVLLEVIAAHSPEGGEFALVTQIAKDCNPQEPSSKKQQDSIAHRMGHLESLGLIEQTERGRGVRYVRINKPWWNLILEELKSQGRKV